jgi:hypothetical protein
MPRGDGLDAAGEHNLYDAFDMVPPEYREAFHPNVRSWAVGVTEPIADLIRVESLPGSDIDPKLTPPDVRVRPVVGGHPEEVMTLETFRAEWPLLKTAFLIAQELFVATNPGRASELGIGSTFDELLEVTQLYLDKRLRALGNGIALIVCG